MLPVPMWPGFVPAPRVDTVGLIGYLNRVAEYARATEPSWPTPLVTSTPLLERRLRFDLNYQQAGNGTNTILIGMFGVNVAITALLADLVVKRTSTE